MIKTALLATAICFAFVVPASAQQTVKCDEASLTKMRTDIEAMTDKEKQKKSMEGWTAADAAFKANKLDDCNQKMGDTGKGMGDSGNTNTNTTTN